MADLKGRYPLATADGQSIPLDIVRPHGILSKTFITASGTAALTCPAAVDMMEVISSEDCLIQFASSAASASALVDGTLKVSAVYIPADVIKIITPPIGMKSFSIIGITNAGIAVIQFLESWSGMSLASQSTRR